MLRNSDSIDRATNNVKAIAFMWYLGGNLKTATVNLTQNIVVGVPRLQMDVTGGAGLFLSGAQKAIKDRITGNNRKGLTDEEAQLVNELFDNQTISAALLDEQRGKLSSSPMGKGWEKVIDIMGLPMAEVEKFNRASLALAAFRAARDGKMKPHARKRHGVVGQKADYAQAKAFAQEVVRDAHFVYGKSNAPEFLRSSSIGRGLPSAAYTFRTFSHNLLNIWGHALSQGKEGHVFIAKSILSTMALGGVAAFPFFATLQALWQAGADDDDDWLETIRNWLPKNNLIRDIACYGLPSMAGVNIGGSLSMEAPFTEPLKRGANFEEVAIGTIKNLIGIPYTLAIEKPSKTIDAVRAGNTQRAVEAAMPTAVSNMMQAFRLATEGQTSLKGKPINSPGESGARKLSTAEAIGKAAGFQPVSSTKSYAAYSASKHSDEVRSNKVDDLTVLGLEALDKQDGKKRHEMIQRMNAWNAEMKEAGKTHMLIKLSDVERRIKARRRGNKVTPKSMVKKQQYESTWK